MKYTIKYTIKYNIKYTIKYNIKYTIKYTTNKPRLVVGHPNIPRGFVAFASGPGTTPALGP